MKPLVGLPVLLGMLLQTSSAAELVLVSDGQARLPIVVSSKPPPAAATDLQRILQKMSGAVLEIVTLDHWNQRSPSAPAMFMACTPMEKAQIANEEWSRVEVRAEGVFFHVNPKAPASTQEKALQYAVNGFAQRVLGCRWLMPGELGEVIPRRKTIRLSPMTLEQNPRFWFRRLRDAQTQFGSKESAHQRALDTLQVASRGDSLKEAEKGMGATDWLMRMNMGARFPFAFGHNFGGW